MRSAPLLACPYFVLRMAGFSMELCESLRFPQALSSIRQIASVADELEDVSMELMRFIRASPGARRENMKLQSSVARRKNVSADLLAHLQLTEAQASLLQRYNQLLSQLALARDDGKQIFERELASTRIELREISADEMFQEAVFLSNPAAWERLRSYLKHPATHGTNAVSRRTQRLIITYLQRFCVKNETVSFFGPARYGKIDSEDSFLTATPRSRLSQRKLFFAHWAARAIEDSLTETFLSTGCASFTNGDRSAAASDNNRQQYSYNSRIPTNTWYPLEFLAPIVSPPHKETEASLISNIKEALMQFPEASFEEKRALLAEMNGLFCQATGRDSVRHRGKAYSDRQIVYEECEYDIPDLRLGAPAIDLLVREYSEVLAALTLPGMIKFQAYRQVFHRWFKTVAGENGSARFLHLREVLRNNPEIAGKIEEEAAAQAGEQTRALIEWFSSLASANAGQSVVRLQPEARAELQSLVGEMRPDLNWPCIFSMDILLAAADLRNINCGKFKLVLGELHSSMGVNGYYSELYQNREKLKESLEGMISGISRGLQPVNFLTPAYNKTFISVDLSFPDIEYAAHALPEKRRIHPADLYLQCHADEVTLHAEGFAEPLFIYSKLPHIMNLLPLRIFTHPFCAMEKIIGAWRGGGPHTPRLECGPIVVFRESWHTTAGELRNKLSALSDFEMFWRAQEYRKECGLPRRVFVRAEGESKPFYLDFDNWLLLDMVIFRLRKLPDQAAVTIEEMCPATEGLWFKDAYGSKTSEFRLTFCQGRS
jgi:hypothetical protein